MTRARRRRLGSPADSPYALATDRSGRIWASMVDSGRLARIDPKAPAADAVTFLDLGGPASRPTQLAVAADGALWCTRYGDDHLERVDPDTGEHRSIPLPPRTQPYGLAATRDGSIWFTAIGREAIGHLTPDATVVFVELPEPGMPSMIVEGADGALWCTVHHLGALARLDPAAETIELHPLRDPDGGPVGLAADADGLWCAQIRSGCVARMRWDGATTDHDLPDRDARPHAVAAAADGGCWVTLWGHSGLAHVHADGTVETPDVLHPDDHPHGLLVTEHGLWVAADSGNLIALTHPSHTPAPPGPLG